MAFTRGCPHIMAGWPLRGVVLTSWPGGPAFKRGCPHVMAGWPLRGVVLTSWPGGL